MLIKDYDIEEVTNQNDIEECTIDILRKWQNEDIHRLHFHFSGHGIINQTVDAYELDQDVMDADTPIWHCLVGNNGDRSLCSVHNIKHLLTQLNPDIITITLDCCCSFQRTRKKTGTKIRLAKLAPIPPEAWRKMVTFYSTCKSLDSNDEDSFSKELLKVYQEQNHQIPIHKMAKMVKDSWNNRRVKQLCTMEIVEVADNWKNKNWPL